MLAAKFSTPEIDPRSRHGAFAQSHRSGNAFWLGRVAHMNKMRTRSKYSQIAAGVYDSSRNAIIFQGLNSTIDRVAFGDASEINN
jgi:hypothetical protein